MAHQPSTHLSYSQRPDARAEELPTIGGGQDSFGLQCVLVEKVFDECTVVECPTVRFTGLHDEPANVVDCEVENVEIINADIPNQGQVAFTVQWDQTVIFTDADGDEFEVTRQFRFRKRVRLPDAMPGMELRFFHLVQCLNCRVRTLEDEGDIIECEVGIFVVVKATSMIQLEIREARLCPQPPECVQISPIGCPEFFEMAESGAFWPPIPFPES